MEGVLLELIPYRGKIKGASTINRYKDIEKATEIAIALLRIDKSTSKVMIFNNHEFLKSVKQK